MQGRMITALFRDTPSIEVTAVHDPGEALELVTARPPDWLLLDLGLPGMSGLEVLQRVKASYPQMPVIVLTGFSDVRTAVQAIKLGAYQFLTKPVNTEELHCHRRARPRAHASCWRRSRACAARWAATAPSDAWWAAAWACRRCFAASARSRPPTSPCWCKARPGWARSWWPGRCTRRAAARANPSSPSTAGPSRRTCWSPSCSGTSAGAFSGADRRKEGLFALADGGTIFLDEIGNLPLPIQAKLLRVIQERKLMPVGATVRPAHRRALHRRHQRSSGERRTRGQVPPGPVLPVGGVHHRHSPAARAHRRRGSCWPGVFARRPAWSCGGRSLASARRRRASSAHSWPGNVRELRNVIRQAVLLAPDSIIEATQIRSLLLAGTARWSRRAGGGRRSQPEGDRRDCRRRRREAGHQEILQRTNGNKSQAARMLRVDYKTLHLKVKRYGLGAGEA